MNNLIKKYEKQLLLVQKDILEHRCPNKDMEIYKNAEQTIILQILRDLRKLNQADVIVSLPSVKLCEKEADRRYAGASFGNDRNVFLEGALWASGNER